MISWRNPDAEQGHFDLDTYAGAVLEARDAVADDHRPAGGAPQRAPARAGSSAAGALGHLAAEGRLGEVASLTLLVCALDNERAGTAAALASRELAAAAVAESARRGYLDGRALGGRVRLAAARTTWSGTTWSTTTCSARSRRRSTSCSGTRTPCAWPPACTATSSASALDNSLARARRARGARRARSTSAPSTSTATSSPASTDHIIPWENAYRSTQLLGGDAALRALHQRPHPGARQPAGAGQPRRATASPTSTPPTPRRGSSRRRRCRAAGGPTTRRGSPRARATLKPAPKQPRRRAGTRRSPRRPAPTSTPS